MVANPGKNCPESLQGELGLNFSFKSSYFHDSIDTTFIWSKTAMMTITFYTYPMKSGQDFCSPQGDCVCVCVCVCVWKRERDTEIIVKCAEFGLGRKILGILWCLLSPIRLQPHGLYPTRLLCLWARILEWVVISSSRVSSRPRDQTPCLLCLLHWQVDFFFYHCAILWHFMIVESIYINCTCSCFEKNLLASFIKF